MTTTTDAAASNLKALKAWLAPQYEAGAHWVIECYSDAELSEEIARHGLTGAKAVLRRHWRIMNEQARNCW